MNEFRIKFDRESLSFRGLHFSTELRAGLREIAKLFYYSTRSTNAPDGITPHALLSLKTLRSFQTTRHLIDNKDPAKYTHAIGLTGGKDSVLLLALLKRFRPLDDIYAFYCPNLNRSESPYERLSARKIALELGVSYVDTYLSNSIKLNRTGHNIALREPVALASLYPWLKPSQYPTHIWFGTLDSFYTVDEKMCASSQAAAHYTLETLMPNSPKPRLCNFSSLPLLSPLKSVDIFFELHKSFPKLVSLTSSCYTQKNFREYRNSSLRKKTFPFPIYHGCGSCLKCLRINASIAAVVHTCESQRQALISHIERLGEKYADDKQLKYLLGLAKSKDAYEYKSVL